MSLKIQTVMVLNTPSCNVKVYAFYKECIINITVYTAHSFVRTPSKENNLSRQPLVLHNRKAISTVNK